MADNIKLLNMGYPQTSYRILGGFIQPYLGHFNDLKLDIQKAGMNYSLEEYVSTMFLTCIIIFAAEFPLITFIVSIFAPFLLAALFSFTISIAVVVIFFFFFFWYPGMKISARKSNISKALPFATTYMTAIASSGVPPYKIFKIFSKFKEYGEIAVEAGKINRDIEMFGMDMASVIKKAAERSPSEEWKDLLWGFLSTTTAGGNIGHYLNEKSKEYMNSYRRRLKEYANQLSLYVEMYLTLIIVGSILFLVLSTIFGSMGSGIGDILMLQFFLVFIFLPLISVGFIVLLKGMNPEG